MKIPVCLKIERFAIDILCLKRKKELNKLLKMDSLSSSLDSEDLCDGTNSVKGYDSISELAESFRFSTMRGFARESWGLVHSPLSV